MWQYAYGLILKIENCDYLKKMLQRIIDYSRNTKRQITVTIKQLGKYSSKVPTHQYIIEKVFLNIGYK